MSGSLLTGHAHLAALAEPLRALEDEVPRIDGWGRRLADVLVGGGRVLAAGNGGSAAQAQHLTAELVGRYRDERPPFSALALHAETSSLTAICNDYGLEDAFARAVRAHGRPGDVLVAFSTSGRSPNIVAAIEAAVDGGLVPWGLTGPDPNPVAALCDEYVAVDAQAAATVQEVHQVALHLLCAAVDRRVTPVLAAVPPGVLS
jgi:D-sedoheptulose 7-phosphate isomerase